MIRTVVARNVERLRDARFPLEKNKNRALAAAAGISLSQVQRILNQSLGTSIDNIEWLANVFAVRPQDLLTPYFSDLHNSPDPPAHTHSVHDAEPPATRSLRRS